ncbi:MULTISPECIES: proline iminopeptidase-family hydrolase [unclassified Pseudomonas]|uniref:proline iminopeptidase-family hydrolase n=1 Tax=unclassified Pseudomonas TaxID=196821 RepID=UPI000C868A80|nr:MULTISPECIES: proline iminopeptidase-family hydrolase [unclassified Pseudomonas]PMV22266.1 alpha/beta hydrolase [Pseudomonas sp. FW305-3-2-15-C-TSA2]PMV23690.1 alpha/beta hydrolase [Pseudomonas sp. DP16D-L5]PMV34667.1 alpha/beta hydrolase [Pseudomonas sp. FW305-3-2-15-A-LB2]PMV41969.1 alpha/beta hydrolase [Pseudomonas sp. FW305-3-2-15-C-R2A1]PMV46503.1 alpha/beta hydrolase [Pseudomonas sp. FW305-3-2-15-C-LB1]
MQVREGYAEFRGHRTWFRVTGDPDSGRLPLIVAHGGPGCTHDYVDSFKDLAATGRAVVHYDQIGNGRSTHLPDAPREYWVVDLFLAELNNLIAHLGIRDYALLGQSWGGILGAEHAVRQPIGLKALIIANSPASMALWSEAANELRQALPADVQATLQRHEAAGTTSSAEYRAASDVFYARHVCRIQPMPAEVARTFAAIDADPTVYHAMNGPTEFHVIGSMRDWTIIDRLPRIQVPTLLISGRYDEATPATVQPFADGIANVQWQIFEASSHMPHVEEREACMACVAAFLEQQPS